MQCTNLGSAYRVIFKEIVLNRFKKMNLYKKYPFSYASGKMQQIMQNSNSFIKKQKVV